MLLSSESWSIMRPKSKKKKQQLADVLYVCSWSLQSNIIIYFSWIQGRDEYEVNFCCFGLISTFLWKSYILCLYPSVTD